MKCAVDACENRTDVCFFADRVTTRDSENYWCDRHAEECFEKFPREVFVGVSTPDVMPNAVCVDLEMAIFHMSPEQTPGCLYMHEVNGERRFATMVSADAYAALMAEIRGEIPERPYTHASWAGTIRELGGVVQDVVIDKLSDADRWLDGMVRIIKDRRLVTVHVRHSDAIILAVINSVPIFAVESGMKKVFKSW